MKNILKYTTLLAISGLTVAVAADTAGLPVPAAVSFELLFGFFIISAAVLLVSTDYARTTNFRPVRVAAKPFLTPVNQSFAPTATRRRREHAPAWTARHRRLRRLAQR